MGWLWRERNQFGMKSSRSTWSITWIHWATNLRWCEIVTIGIGRGSGRKKLLHLKSIGVKMYGLITVSGGWDDYRPRYQDFHNWTYQEPLEKLTNGNSLISPLPYASRCPGDVSYLVKIKKRVYKAPSS